MFIKISIDDAVMAGQYSGVYKMSKDDAVMAGQYSGVYKNINR